MVTNICNHSLISIVQLTMTGNKDSYYIEKVLKGDVRYFEFLVEKNKDFVFNLALKITRNREDAKEVAQDTFLKAYQSLKDFKGKS